MPFSPCAIRPDAVMRAVPHVPVSLSGQDSPSKSGPSAPPDTFSVHGSVPSLPVTSALEAREPCSDSRAESKRPRTGCPLFPATLQRRSRASSDPCADATISRGVAPCARSCPRMPPVVPETAP